MKQNTYPNIQDALDLIPQSVWEQRRYEIAKELVKNTYTFSLNTICKHGLPEEYEELSQSECLLRIIAGITDDAVKIADALILRLRQC